MEFGFGLLAVSLQTHFSDFGTPEKRAGAYIDTASVLLGHLFLVNYVHCILMVEVLRKDGSLFLLFTWRQKV